MEICKVITHSWKFCDYVLNSPLGCEDAAHSWKYCDSIAHFKYFCNNITQLSEFFMQSFLDGKAVEKSQAEASGILRRNNTSYWQFYDSP